MAGVPVQDGRVVIDLDATLLDAHSEKEDATRTWKKGFGFHPLLSFVDHGGPSGGEPVAELLRPGKAGSNTAADHVVVLDAALAQLPAERRTRDETGRIPVLVRTDAAGATKEFAAHLHEHGVEFSVGASFAHLDIHTGRPLVAQVVDDPADLLDAPPELDLALVDAVPHPELLDRLPAHLSFLVVGDADLPPERDRILGTVRIPTLPEEIA